MSNTEWYDGWSEPPETALKQIKGGRLRGMTDINPQWRMRALTERFGPAGVGWTYSIDKLWTEQTGGASVAVFALVSLRVRTGDDWSEAVPGIGGNQLVQVESDGPHVNDECYKMAVTDALSVACKALGIGAAIYEGRWDGSKYRHDAGEPVRPSNWKSAVTGKPLVQDAAPTTAKAATAPPAAQPAPSAGGGITEAQGKRLFAKARDAGLMPKGADGRLNYAPYHKFLVDLVGVKDDRQLTRDQYDEVCSMLDALKDGVPVDDAPQQLPIHDEPADAGADDIPF